MKLILLTSGLTNSNLVTIACAILTASVTVSSVYFSHRLGQRKYFTEIKIRNKSERYENFYLPLLKTIYYESDNTGIWLGAFYKYQRQNIYYSHKNDPKDHESFKYAPYNDEIVEFIMSNLKYASPELLSKCLRYSKVSASIYWSAHYTLYANHALTNESDKFNKINTEVEKSVWSKYNDETLQALAEFVPLIEQILEETQALSIDLQSKDLTTPLKQSLRVGQENSNRLIKALKESTDFELTLIRSLSPLS
ncbi:hypothetical protein ACFP1L_12095 [Lactiplantibacillus nangangensis]|uniref:Uncharacterized protein n=1 Tax=Lactiplantibacillus nangangensis TaxID=2559917 RepID=A0ABW1SMK4_9LACO|nr:hypothetical protein [Lactiplantibacillus nangangensis]